jgi:sterol desaturase/sphingolipid hydroxylase (fatty acid hydroxylase superfamily)
LIHHPKFRLPLLGRLRRWHLEHHYSKKAGNFGVTTPVWDYVFRTAIATRRIKHGHG